MKKLSIGLIMSFFILYKNEAASNIPEGMGPYGGPTGGPHMSPQLLFPPYGCIQQYDHVNNEPQPQVVIGSHTTKFGTEPVQFYCPYCKKHVTTKVQRKISPCALSSCILSLCIFYVIVQACRDKEKNCYDAVHKCPNCNNELGSYTAI